MGTASVCPSRHHLLETVSSATSAAPRRLSLGWGPGGTWFSWVAPVCYSCSFQSGSITAQRAGSRLTCGSLPVSRELCTLTSGVHGSPHSCRQPLWAQDPPRPDRRRLRPGTRENFSQHKSMALGLPFLEVAGSQELLSGGSQMAGGSEANLEINRTQPAS